MKKSRMRGSHLGILAAMLGANPHTIPGLYGPEGEARPAPPRKPDTTLSERDQHNAAIEAKRQAKLAARKARRRTQPTGRV